MNDILDICYRLFAKCDACSKLKMEDVDLETGDLEFGYRGKCSCQG